MIARFPRLGNKEAAYVVTVLLLLGISSPMIIPVSTGTLALVKGSWDVVGLDHNKVADGPNQYLIQIHVTNTAGTAALSVSGTLTWDTANTYINLGPSEVATKSLGDIAAGATVDLFYLIEVTRDSNAYNTTRDYTITVQGTNTGTADTITGQLLVERLRSQARNEVLSMVPSTTTPTAGDTFTITVNSETGAKNYAWVNLPCTEYDPTVIEPVSVSVTYDTTTSDNVALNLPGSDVFTSVWTFRAVAPGTSGATSFITDQSGGSFHYNADYPDSITITVLGEADLRMEKTVSDPTPNVGDTVTFTITVYNDGPDTATNIGVEDVIPNGYTYVAASIAGGDSRSDAGVPTLTWTINSLANGANTALTFQAVVQASGDYRNVAQVTASDQNDPDSTPDNDDGDQSEDDEDFATTTPIRADLRMEKTVSDPTPNVGDTVTFTITVYNDGPDTATNIGVEDVIPNGYTYVAASIAGGDSRSDAGVPTLTWTINSLANGANTALTFQAVVQAAGNYRNVAQVIASDQNDPDSTPNNDDGDQSEDDEDFADTTPQQADLRIEKTVSDPTPNVGDTVTFTITVYNDGPDTATNIDVEDVIPNGYTYVAASIAGGDSRSDAGVPTLTWTINSLANGANTALTFQAVVQASGDYRNVAQVTASDQNDPDSAPNNDDGDQSEDDEDYATTTPQQADLRIEKTVSDPTPTAGDTVTFTITVYNDGPDTATNIDVEDVIPTGFTYVAASIAGGDSRDDTGAPTLTWTINSLASGNNTALTFQAVVQASGDYKNVAQVTASDQQDPDSTPNNDDGDQSEDDEDFAIAAPSEADLRIEKTVSDPNPSPGDTVTFTITVYNDGPDTATNIDVEDVIPNGYTYVAASIAGGDSRDDTGVPTLTWTINSLANGANTALTFQAVVQAAGNYRNVAQVTASDQYDPDSTPNNDDGDQSEDDEDFAIASPQQADLRMTKTVSNPTPNVGDTVTFTITVYNDGPDAATNIDVEDVISNGYTYVAASIAGGDSRSDAGVPTLTWTINNLANGANTALTFQAVVQAAGNYRNIAQVTASDQNDPDSAPNNDDGDQSEDDEDFATATPSQADLRMTKTVSNPTPNVGDTVTFTITVYNDGPDAATNIDVEDVIPNGYTYVAASIAGGDSRSDAGVPTLTWTINNLANGANTALTFQAVVQATGTYKNVAQVTASDQQDPDSTPNNDDGDQSEDDEDAAFATPQEADLRMEKTVSNPAPNVGDTVTFTITVYNDGPDTATNVSVADVIPTGYTYVPASIAGGDSRDDTGLPTLTWTINSLANGNNTALTFQAVVQAAGNYRNIAQVTASDQYDPDSTPNNDDGDQSEDDEDYSTAIPGGAPPPGIDIVKTVSPSVASPGTLVTFTLTITNTGGVPLNPVEVVDTLSAGLTYADAANIPPDTVVINPDGTTTITWLNVGPLNPGQSITITFMALFNGIETSARNIGIATGTDPGGIPISDLDVAAVIVPPSTLNQPNVSLQPLAYSRMMVCYDEFLDLINRIREANPDIQWLRRVPCCEALEELVRQLIEMVLEKGLDEVYPEKWARIQELLPYVEECCKNISQYYDAENYEASNYWSIQRNEAYREIIELLLEMLES